MENIITFISKALILQPAAGIGLYNLSVGLVFITFGSVDLKENGVGYVMKLLKIYFSFFNYLFKIIENKRR